jgi:hypothetical protein
MSTFKDIIYKKNDDETWAEWSKRVPDNDKDKLDYIGETIYVRIQENGKENASNITGLLLCIGLEGLIPLLESNELLDAKIEEAYDSVYKFEEYNMSEEEARVANEELLVEKEQDKECKEKERIYNHDVYKQPVVTLTVAEMIEALSKLPLDAKLVMTESGFYSKSDFAEVMLPMPYKVANNNWVSELPTGTQVYIIGHSHQWY